MQLSDRMLGPLVLEATATSACGSPVSAEKYVVQLHSHAAGEVPSEGGSITFRDSEFGVLITPDLGGLASGLYGLHLHDGAICESAGGHFDPENTGRHEGPYGKGHLGDLPNLTVDADGTAWLPVLAPRLKLSDVKDHAIMLPGGADHYDHHAEHSHGTGGGGMFCGEVSSSSQPAPQSAATHVSHEH